MLALGIVVLVATVRGITDQADEIGSSVDAAIAELVESIAVDEATMEKVRSAIEDLAPTATHGFLTELFSGLSAAVALAGAVILGALIMYYLLKDGARLRQAVVATVDPRLRPEVDDFIGDSCRTLRNYGSGRTVMSAIVAIFIG